MSVFPPFSTVVNAPRCAGVRSMPSASASARPNPSALYAATSVFSSASVPFLTLSITSTMRAVSRVHPSVARSLTAWIVSAPVSLASASRPRPVTSTRFPFSSSSTTTGFPRLPSSTPPAFADLRLGISSAIRSTGTASPFALPSAISSSSTTALRTVSLGAFCSPVRGSTPTSTLTPYPPFASGPTFPGTTVFIPPFSSSTTPSAVTISPGFPGSTTSPRSFLLSGTGGRTTLPSSIWTVPFVPIPITPGTPVVGSVGYFTFSASARICVFRSSIIPCVSFSATSQAVHALLTVSGTICRRSMFLASRYFAILSEAAPAARPMLKR